jgi:hypothetical protein
MCPGGAQLEEHMRIRTEIESNHQKSGSTKESPMAKAALAEDPAVSIAKTHGEMLP